MTESIPEYNFAERLEKAEPVNCHLCKTEINDPYWIMDMKFCKCCFDAITHGDIERLK